MINEAELQNSRLLRFEHSAANKMVRAQQKATTREREQHVVQIIKSFLFKNCLAEIAIYK